MDPFGRRLRDRFAAIVLALGIAAAACGSNDPAPAPAAPPPLDFIEFGSRSSAWAPLVFAVHGLGDQPENLAKLYVEAEAPYHLVLPRGPIPYGEGSSWFEIDIPYAPDAALGARIAAAADRIDALLGWFKAHRPTSRIKPVVTGFSQGGMIAFAVAVRHPGSISLAVPISGALPPDALPSSPAPKGAPLIRALHGTADDLVSAEYARRTIAALKAAGWDASLEEYAGVGHDVSAEMRNDALAVIKAATSD